MAQWSQFYRAIWGSQLTPRLPCCSIPSKTVVIVKGNKLLSYLNKFCSLAQFGVDDSNTSWRPPPRRPPVWDEIIFDARIPEPLTVGANFLSRRTRKWTKFMRWDQKRGPVWTSYRARIRCEVWRCIQKFGYTYKCVIYCTIMRCLHISSFCTVCIRYLKCIWI